MPQAPLLTNHLLSCRQQSLTDPDQAKDWESANTTMRNGRPHLPVWKNAEDSMAMTKRQ
jgi:hypothetical protein